MPYIGRSTDGFGVRNRFVYLASSGDTSVSGADANGATLTFTDGAYVDVYLNGVLLKPTTDYNTSTAGTIAGLSALNTNDEVTVIVYDVFTVGDMVSATSGGTFTGNVTHNGTVTFGSTVSGLDVNGTEIILDADGDTTITADTDDQIDIKIAGADDFQFTANTFTAQSGSTIAAQALTATTGTFSDDLIVDTNTLFVDASTNKVHINSTSADADTSGLSCEFAGGNNYVAHFENTTNATPYTVAITEPGSPGTAYPLLWVGTSSSGYLRVDSGTGVVTESKKPIFICKYRGFESGTSYTNPASNYQTPAINIGSHFNSSTGVFTAPTAGTYIFFGSVISANNSVVVRLYFEKNGSVTQDNQHEARTTEGYSGYDKQFVHAIFTLAANDTIELVIYQDSTNTFYATNDHSYNSFSGYLIG